MSTNKIKVMLVDDHELTRVGLKVILNDDSTIEIIGEARDGETAVRNLRELNPDVVIMDLNLQILSGIDATKEIKKINPLCKVIILTSYDSYQEVFAALAAGADAYCLKDIKSGLLAVVVKSVYEGALWLDSAIGNLLKQTHPLISHLEVEKFIVSTNDSTQDSLTDREIEVLRLITQGYTNTQIADTLNLSRHTVKSHVCNILQKLKVTDRTQAAIKAIKIGIVTRSN